jgi:hypothetical protein
LTQYAGSPSRTILLTALYDSSFAVTLITPPFTVSFFSQVLFALRTRML